MYSGRAPRGANTRTLVVTVCPPNWNRLTGVERGRCSASCSRVPKNKAPLGQTDGAHRLAADRGAVVAHVTFHHEVILRFHLGHAERAGQHAVVAADAARLAGAEDDAVLLLFDGVGRANLGAGRRIAVHADDRHGLRRARPVHVFQVNHRPAAVRVALAARLLAGAAADAAIGVDEELHVSGTGMSAPSLSNFSPLPVLRGEGGDGFREGVDPHPRLPRTAGERGNALVLVGGPSARRTRTAHTLNSGILEIGSCAAMVTRLMLRAPAQWYGTNTVSGRIVVTTCAAACRRRGAIRPCPVAVGDAEFFRQARVHFDHRLGVLVHQRSDAPRLRAGEELADHAAGREHDRVVVVHVLGRRRVGGDDEPRLAVGEIETPFSPRDWVPRTFLEQPRRAGVVLARTGPEDAVFALQPLVGDAGVIGDAAGGGAASSSKISRGPANVKPRSRPSFLAMSWMMRQSSRAPPGLSTALLILTTRPSICVTTPSSSSCNDPGRTIFACCAVSLRKKSMAT